MKCDSRVSLLACTFVNPCFGREPKVRVAITTIFYQDYLGDASRGPTTKSNSKGENVMEYKSYQQNYVYGTNIPRYQ
jgi:hypothetical protein